MTPLEDRLRAEMRAESEQITPEAIPALQLPGPAPRRAGRPRLAGPRPWPAWVIALTAAAAVIAVILGTFAIVQAVSRSAGKSPAAAGGWYSGVPRYYAYAIEGSTYSRAVHGTQSGDSVIARYVGVRATASGKLLTTVSPPAPYDAFESFTGAASDRVFVFAAQWYIGGKFATSPGLYRRDQETPLKFVILRIGPGGRTRLSPLSLHETLTEGQAPTLALSPDGTRLAVAYGGSGRPAVVQVITLATGRVRQWVSRPPAATPVLGGPGAWTADGRVLALGQELIAPDGTISTSPTRMLLLDTAAPGSNLAAARLVTLRGADSFPWPFLTPDGSMLIGATGGGSSRPGRNVTESGAIGEYSARTGALLRVVGRWHRHGGLSIREMPRQAVAWSDYSGSRLVVEMPRGNSEGIGFLTGNTFTRLPHAALAPLLQALNSGGFQTTGGYVGFAW